MALLQIGTNANNSLRSLPAWSESLLDADIAAIAQGITSDFVFGSVLGGGAPGASAVLATGSTHTSTTLDTLVVAAGGAPLAAIQVGMKVLSSADIRPGTFVAAILSSTSVLLSQAATGGGTGRNIAFAPVSPPALSRQQQLIVPNRGILKVLPGDYVALDLTTGFPILISGEAVSASGSAWNT
jgi:hypothetical protein